MDEPNCNEMRMGRKTNQGKQQRGKMFIISGIDAGIQNSDCCYLIGVEYEDTAQCSFAQAYIAVCRSIKGRLNEEC